MRRLRVILWVTALCSAAWYAADQARPVLPSASGQEAPESGFALVELFTSEGCSSCPPADRLLGEIAADAKESKQQVYALAFHVDYWDHLGWRDPYGSRDATVRQRKYHQALGSRGLYTPQMIVNGQAEFVGSSRARARREIADALGRPATVTISASATLQAEQLTVSYEVDAVTADATVCVALARREVVSDVKRGENSGKTLTHHGVVQTFTTATLQESGELTLPWPEGLATAEVDVVVFVQDARMATQGAALAALE